MGQVDSQPVPPNGPSPSEPLARKEVPPGRRRPAGSTADDAQSQASARSSFTNKTARSPLSWAAAGADLVASTTADFAVTTMNAAFKTASVLASTTEAAANVVANTTTNVALNTASVATQTASLITTATSVGAKTAGDAIAGTASLVVEGFTPTVPTTSPKHLLVRDARSRSRSGDSSNHLSPQHRASFFATTGGRAPTEMMLPEAMALGAVKSSSSHDNLSEIEQKGSMRNVGTRFWCMVGATNISARKHWVATVTSSKPSAPSAKYLRKILALAWETKGQSVDEFYRLVQIRPITTSPSCALKSLITTLRIIREGPPEALSLSVSYVGLIDAVGAAWAERVLFDVPPENEEGSSQTTLIQPQPPLVPTTPQSGNKEGRPTSPQSLLQQKKDDFLDEMLIARLSGLLVQKMHFHSTHVKLNARYETVTSRPSAASVTGDSPQTSDEDESVPKKQDNDENEWESNVQLSSSLLTLLGTIEGVARLALGMGGRRQSPANCPSPAALSLSALLIEEALSAFDALSSTLVQTAGDTQDSTVVRSLLARYHEAYLSMRAYCGAALEFPYVAALNKVPRLDNELSPLSRGAFPLSRHPSVTNSNSQPWTAASSSSVTPPLTLYATNDSKKSSSAPAKTTSSSLNNNNNPPSLAARPFTRRSILETLEEEEALEHRLGSVALSTPLHEDPVKSNSIPASPSRSDSDLSEPTRASVFNPWEYSSNSVEHARPPKNFCLETEEEDESESEEAAPEAELLSSRPSPVRTRTLGNPFDTGNSSIILLAEAHRSAFSTISNPFASGQFNNAFATNQQPQQQLLTSKQVSEVQDKKQLTQKQLQVATKRALEQCERLFEFSGINLRPEDLVMSNDMIGRGAFSIVHRAKLVSNGQEVAVKELLLEELGKSPETILDFRAEVAVMKAVHHPNVLQLIGASTTPNLRLISEFCHRGNLFDLLYSDRQAQPQASRTLQWSLRLRMALGEARGMHFLHTAFPAPLIHRDLKSLNLLLSKNWTLKVSDFGLSRFRRRGVNESGPCGTTQWMAPEVIIGKDYDERADVYSFGINLWELCSRRVPWEGRADVKQAVVAGERPKLDLKTLDAGCPPQLVALIERCWQADPSQRPDFEAIVNELKVVATLV